MRQPRHRVAKLIAGLISGSAAMLSEAAHSVADTTTEVLLYLALRRGARPADARHPFGYGKESYVWAFFAAHVHLRRRRRLRRHPRRHHDPGARAQRRLPGLVHRAGGLVRHRVDLPGPGGAAGPRESRRWQTTPRRFLRLTADTTVKAVFLEDSAALIGLLLAGAGVGLSHATGDELWDGVASILIGLLLLTVAGILAAQQPVAAGRSGGPASGCVTRSSRSWPGCPRWSGSTP